MTQLSAFTIEANPMAEDGLARYRRSIILTLTPEEWNYLMAEAGCSETSNTNPQRIDAHVTSLVRELIADDVAEERKRAS